MQEVRELSPSSLDCLLFLQPPAVISHWLKPVRDFENTEVLTGNSFFFFLTGNSYWLQKGCWMWIWGSTEDTQFIGQGVCKWPSLASETIWASLLGASWVRFSSPPVIGKRLFLFLRAWDALKVCTSWIYEPTLWPRANRIAKNLDTRELLTSLGTLSPRLLVKPTK